MIEDAHAVASLGEIPEDNLMCETDYPHSDSTWPNSIKIVKDIIGHLPEETQYKILRGNAERLYRFTPAQPPVLATA
jgi:predicted TIM-barrel fold metal-dependent hydrolase